MRKFYFLALSALLSTGLSGQCTTPTISVNPASACSGTSASLIATTNGTIVKWYDSASSTTVLNTGTTYNTPPLTSGTSYWAEAVNYATGTTVIGGKTTPGTSSSAVVAGTSPWGLSFDTYSDFVIQSVDVFASAGGSLQIALLDANYASVQEITVTVPSGGSSSAPLQHTIPLNFFVQANKTYRLVARSSPSMRRDLAIGGFPYPLGSLGAITGGTINNNPGTNATAYYFFFNWNVASVSQTCKSTRVESAVTVNPSPAAPTAVAAQSIPQGSTLASLVVNGQNLAWYSNATLTTPLPATTQVTNGVTYYVTQTVNGCPSPATAITVTVNLATLETAANKFKIYPNPVTDVLTIETHEKVNQVSVYDAAGRVVYSEKPKSSSIIKLNLGKLSSGKYLLKIEGSETVNYPVIKK